MSSIGTTEESISDWLELDDNISVPPQTIEEILADELIEFEDESAPYDDDSSLQTGSGHLPPSQPSYQLDCPIILTRLEPTSSYLTSQNVHCTAFAVSRLHVAIGTTRGTVLIFDRSTGRILNSVRGDDQGESISCLAFSTDGTKIAIGTCKGIVKIVGANSGKVFEKGCEAVQPGRGVLQVDFVLKNRRLLLLDNGGSVFEYRFTSSPRLRCVFSGSNGEVVRMNVIRDELVTLVTLTKIVILSVNRTRVVFATPFSGSPRCPPLFEWSSMRSSQDSIISAFARGSEVIFFHLSRDAHGAFASYCSRNVKVIGDIINMKFLSEYELLVLDSSESLTLIDAQIGALVDNCDGSTGQLVYGSSFFKGLSTGGNVSAAMVHLSDRVCYQSVCQHGDTVYILGRSLLTFVHIGDEVAQLETFESRGEIIPAVLYALDVFNGKITSRKSLPEVRKSISARMPRLITILLEKTMHGIEKGSADELYNHYKKHISILIRACVSTKFYDLLYSSILQKVQEDPLSSAVFFDSLDDIVQEGLLQNPPPALIQEYIAHLAQENHAQIESAVKHLPIESLNIDQIMRICNKYHLYDAIIFINNNAFLDFISPLEQMLNNVSEFCQKEVLSDCEIAQGNKLLMYISCCLTGQAYPYGALTPEMQNTVPMEIYRCLISLRGKEGILQGSYPNLRILLQFDAQQFFHVIYTCADTSALADDWLHKLVDVLHGLIKEMGKQNPIIFSHFLSFLTLLLQKDYIFRKVNMIADLIDSVFASEWAIGATKDSSEQCIIDAMNCMADLDLDRILRMALKLPHVQIAAFIYTQKHEYTQIISCYLRYRVDPQAVFSVILRLLETIRGDYLDKFRSYMKTVILDLCSLDAYRTAELVLDRFPEFLQNQRKLPYDLLNNCFKIRREYGLRYVTGNEALDEKLFNSTFNGHLLRNEISSAEKGLLAKWDIIFNDELRYWLPLGSASDFCLNLAVEHKLTKCSVALLRARDLPERAFELLFEALRNSDPSSVVGGIDDILDLCNDLQNEAREGNWLLQLFQHILSFPDIATNTELSSRVNAIILSIVESGSSGAENLVRTLFDHKSFVNGQYSMFSSLITSILDSCQYEVVLLEAALRCQEIEMFQRSEAWIENSQRGVCLALSDECVVCHEGPRKSSFIFQCGHMVHMDCVDAERICPCQKSSILLHHHKTFDLNVPVPPKKSAKVINLISPAMGSLQLSPSVSELR